MRCVLIYNPVAGTDRSLRREQVQQICALLEANGHSATAVETTATGSATNQARTAIAAGCDCLFACGGDGTAHDILQGIVAAASAPPTILGVIPMGSANALARHLRLSMSPLEAARQQLTFMPHLISVGVIECGGHRRPFTVMAGAGADGVLVHRLMHGSKQRFGRLTYYLHAARLFVTHRFSPFDIAYVDAPSGTRHTLRAVSAMALRIDDLGGLFARIASGGQVHHPHLQLVIVRPPAWFSLPLWFVAGWLGLSRWNPFVRTISVSEFACTPAPNAAVHVQADGEWLGTAPISVTLLPDAVRLLMPPPHATGLSGLPQ